MTLISANLEVHKYLAEFAFPFHRFCTEQAQGRGSYTGIYSALACGDTTQVNPAKGLFKNLGLTHFLVVSGAHMAFLEAWLLRIKVKSYWVTIALGLFTLMSGARPPALRAWVFILIFQINKKYRLNASPTQCLLFTGALLLGLLPHWWTSLSFIMSFLASLLIHCVSGSHLKICTALYLGLLPVYLMFGLPHPQSILMNWIFAPVFASLLFPVSVLAHFVSDMIPLANALWGWSLIVLERLQIAPPAAPLVKSFSPWLLWIYLGLLIFMLRKRVYASS